MLKSGHLLYTSYNKEHTLFSVSQQKTDLTMPDISALDEEYTVDAGNAGGAVAQKDLNYHLKRSAVYDRSYARFKHSLTSYDKVFYFYTLQVPLSMYAHKAFIILEMQVNATLVRSKLVPYLFMARDFCFYRLVQLNTGICKYPHQVVAIYDSISIPIYIHNYMYYRQYRLQHYPKAVARFFKYYWLHFTNYMSNKVWILSNMVASDVIAAAVVFDYPNISLYMGPFQRFTRLFYRNHPYAPRKYGAYLTHTHSVLKLHLFEFAAFYK